MTQAPINPNNEGVAISPDLSVSSPPRIVVCRIWGLMNSRCDTFHLLSPLPFFAIAADGAQRSRYRWPPTPGENSREISRALKLASLPTYDAIFRFAGFMGITLRPACRWRETVCWHMPGGELIWSFTRFLLLPHRSNMFCCGIYSFCLLVIQACMHKSLKKRAIKFLFYLCYFLV